MTTWDGQSRRVAQASGMVSVQAACTIEEAVVLMQARADETLHTLEQIAGAVVERGSDSCRRAARPHRRSFAISPRTSPAGPGSFMPMASDGAGARGLPTPYVAIASGIVAEQTGCTLDDAIGLLSERAEASGSSIEDTAASVIEQQNRA